ncbi:MAG: radical SAM protein [Aureliella sp.]
MPSDELSSDKIVRLRPPVDRPAPGLSPLDVQDEWEASSAEGRAALVRTIFLRGSECRFRCVMCDLWRYTHEGTTPAGAIAAQVRQGLDYATSDPSSDQRPQWLKLYNASSFFDPLNVPAADLPQIAALVRGMQRVIVENHPRILPWPAIEDFQERLSGQLEIALGLETVDPVVLKKLNKRITIDDFATAARGLRQRKIDLRAFVLLRPPWTEEAAALEWCRRSIEFAIEHGARHVTVIPVRGGNGALEWLAAQGEFEPPQAESLEKIVQEFIADQRCVVTADLWDWNKLRGTCPQCSEPRRLRLERMNLTRRNEPPIPCQLCHS